MALVQSVPLLGLTAGAALFGVGVALAVALFLALVAASMSHKSIPTTPPPPDPQSAITTMAGSIEDIRAKLPPGDYRAWSEHGRTATEF